MQNLNNKKQYRNPWTFVPTEYFAQGIPFVIVNELSVAMLKTLGASNYFIGITSFLYLPWSLKFFWSPVIDSIKTKRYWNLLMQLTLCVTIILIPVSFMFGKEQIINISLVFLMIIAFISSAHDIAIDGFYLHSLNKSEQAFFSGIRNMFYRIAKIFTGGLLLILAGHINSITGNPYYGWSCIFIIISVIFFFLFLYHFFMLPYPPSDISHDKPKETGIPYLSIFREYFSRKKIAVIIAFILLYRFGEALLLKMVQPFLLDSPLKGGLGISLQDIGIIYGTIGVLFLIIGGVLGGYLIKKYGLKKIIWPMALSIHLPNLFFIYLALYQSNSFIEFNLNFINPSNPVFIKVYPVIQAVIIIEQFGYGLGFTAFMVYLLYSATGEYKTSHYAISTGIMAIGMMIPGFLSGIIQEHFGYLYLFIISCIATIPGTLLLFFIPMEEEVSKE